MAGKPKRRGVARVPLFIQLENRECGAVCLSMVAAYYGYHVPTEQTRIDCGVSRNGTSAGAMVRAAREYGFVARGFSYTADKLRATLCFPCIIHWDMKHFVVLCGFRGKKAYINDPKLGRLIIGEDEFVRRFTGVCIEIFPGEDYKTRGTKKSMLSLVRTRLSGLGGAVAAIVAVMAINSLFGIIDPTLSGLFYDRILGAGDEAFFLPFIGIISAVAASEILVSLFFTLYKLKLDRRLAEGGTRDFMKKLFRLPVVFFDHRSAGDLLMRAATNSSISLSLVSTIAPLFIQSLMMVFYLVVMLRSSLPLTALGIMTVALNLWFSYYIAGLRTDMMRAITGRRAEYNSLTVSAFEMPETIRSIGATHGFFDRWSRLLDELYEGKLSFAIRDSRVSFLPGVVTALSGDLVLIAGVYLTVTGDFTLGLTMAFHGYLSGFMNPTTTLMSAGESINTARADMERVEDVLSFPPDPLVPEHIFEKNTATNERLSGRISIKNMTFGYARFEEPQLRDISIEISPGEKIAVCGASGCGKTTLVRLLAGLYLPREGEICYDGVPVAEVEPALLRDSLAVVDQDIYLFNDTIRENIRLWDESISDEAIIASARAAAFLEVLGKKEGGLSEPVTPEGKNLSGGEKQRLAITGALSGAPSILILDEATGALDAATEKRIMDALRDRGITMIVVSHRLSAISDADRIIVLRDGRIEEQGRHEELIASGGEYFRLFGGAL